jgi:hypothetical protein
MRFPLTISSVRMELVSNVSDTDWEAWDTDIIACQVKLVCRRRNNINEVGAQGDPCTATIFWSIMSPHLLYSSGSPVPLTKLQYLTKRNLIIVAWFHKKIFTYAKTFESR